MEQLHYKKHYRSSDSKWIVFLHGAGGNVSTWKHQLKALEPHFNLLTVDLRDHGKSKGIQPASDSYNFDLIASDINKVLEKEKISKAHFVTLSFGSVLIQALHQRRPEIVDRMVLIGGIFNANWMIKGFVYLARLFNLFLSYPSMYRTFSYLLMPKKRNQLARRVYQMQAQKLNQEEYLKWLGLYSEFFTLLRAFHAQKINNEILILMGEDDYLFLPSARAFSINRPGVKLKLIQKAGHICNIDNPDNVNSEIITFLSTPLSLAKKQETTALCDTNS